MQTFEEKLNYACSAFNVTLEEVCEATRISPLAIHLHASGQRFLNHNEMVFLCEYFRTSGDYFTNPLIRFVDDSKVTEEVKSLLCEISNPNSKGL